eukprot:Awhi_evm1s13253
MVSRSHKLKYLLVWDNQNYKGHRNATMAKSKNHTNHNQNYKAHRNGIKKPQTFRCRSLKG